MNQIINTTNVNQPQEDINVTIDKEDIKKNLIFYKSPIGKALIGKNKGEMISVTTPSGERNFEILDVEYI